MTAAAAQAGSPLTLSILQDGTVTATQLDLHYVRHVKCVKPDLPPEIKIVKEKGTLHLGGKKSFYISERKIDDSKTEVCFMPEQTVSITTGGSYTGEQVIPAQTWNQASQQLDIGRVIASIGSVRLTVDASCMGGGKLDTENNQKILKIRQVGALSTKAKSGKAGGGKPGGGETQIQLVCEVTP